MEPEIQKFNNTNKYAEAAVEAIESFLAEKLKEKKVVRVALSGGSSPVSVYEALTQSKKIPWSRVALFLVDERYVPLNSKDSNAKLIEEKLIDKVSNLRRFYKYNTRDPIPTIIDQYEKTLQQFESPLFDLVLLGLGEDGHIASLFPSESALHEERQLVAHTHSPNINTQDRLTLTFPAILDSQKIIFLIQGKNKESVIEKWLDKNVTIDQLPAKGVLDHPNIEVFFDTSI